MATQRRRRQQPGEDAPGDKDEVHTEDEVEGPRGPPTTLSPVVPLFTPEQLRGLHEVQEQARSPRQRDGVPEEDPRGPSDEN